MTADPSLVILRDRDRTRLQALLRNAADRLGFDPADQSVVLDQAAVAIARLAWRDSPVEDWHAAPDSRINDAELMRATVNVTRGVRELLDIDNRVRLASPPGSLLAGCPQIETPAPCARIGISAGALDAVAVMLTAPDRRLPDGRQLREVAPSPGQLVAYSDHVHDLAGQWAALADHVGPPALLMLLASYAAVSCRRWWLGLDWPYLVTEFVARLRDPDRWGDAAVAAHVPGLTRPREAADLDQLEELLLAGPDLLNTESARYCLRAGIGHLLPRDYHRPPRPRRCLPHAVLALVEPTPTPGASTC
jgi:hypothetical protein